MNGRKARKLRSLAKQLAVSKLRLLVPASEEGDITVETLSSIEADKYVYKANGCRINSLFSSRWFLQKMKKFLKNGVKLTPEAQQGLMNNAKA